MSEINVGILGSTGSIGTQALEVLDKLCNAKIHSLSTNCNIALLERQIRKFKPKIVAVAKEKFANELKIKVSDTFTKVVSGKEGLCEAATQKNIETLLTSVVGISGLVPTIEAIKSKKNIALANKETLVTAGDIVMSLSEKSKTSIIPVDSEHSAIFQSLMGNNKNEVKKIILTASGGPFFGKTKNELLSVSVKDALAHPNWSMGNKITIDSATLMNKGLEVIEAKHLFNIDIDKIEVLVHRESIIHSMVEYVDNSIIAQLGTPDMKTAIQFALTYPNRKPLKNQSVDFAKISSLTFAKPDFETFSCLSLAFEAIKKGGTMPAVLNGANEAAVDLFLKGKIRFLEIAELVYFAMNKHKIINNPSLNDILNADMEARENILINNN